MDSKILDSARAYIESFFLSEFSGHDAAHSFRVARTAKMIALEERADCLIVELAALLHDVDDRKISPETYKENKNARSFLEQNNVEEKEKEKVLSIISEVSFRGTDSVVPKTIEGKCVQDADRLDAIGAIGIARAFAYGGYHKRVMYDPKIKPEYNLDEENYYLHESTTINHFYEKLLKLSSMMQTSTGRKLASQRDEYMRSFLTEFYSEWDGIK